MPRQQGGHGEVEIWGTGAPLREFLYVTDLADACVYLLKHYSGAAPINVGSGQEISIRDLAMLMAEVIGFDGRFAFDASKPDGTPRKLLDVGCLTNLGWKANTSLKDGIATVYHWYCQQLGEVGRNTSST